MNYSIRPVTQKMLRQLQAGRAIELSENAINICFLKDFKGSLSGLYKRGLVNTKRVTVDGKEIVGVYITQAGIALLERYEEENN